MHGRGSLAAMCGVVHRLRAGRFRDVATLRGGMAVARALDMSARRLVPFLVASVVLLVAASASAEPHKGSSRLALDLDYAMPAGEHGFHSGLGGAIRLGEKANLALVSLTGEIGGGYQPFSGLGAKLYSGFIGGRIGLGGILEPGVYGHLGLSHIHFDLGSGTRTAPRLDGGLYLDLTALPLVDVGIHGGYDSVLSTNRYPAFNYFIVGAHAAIAF